MTDRNEEKLTNGDDKAMRFTRTTSYANSKVLTSSSKAVIKYRKKGHQGILPLPNPSSPKIAQRIPPSGNISSVEQPHKESSHSA